MDFDDFTTLWECSDSEQTQSSKMRDIVIMIVSTKIAFFRSLTGRSCSISTYSQTIEDIW